MSMRLTAASCIVMIMLGCESERFAPPATLELEVELTPVSAQWIQTRHPSVTVSTDSGESASRRLSVDDIALRALDESTDSAIIKLRGVWRGPLKVTLSFDHLMGDDVIISPDLLSQGLVKLSASRVKLQADVSASPRLNYRLSPLGSDQTTPRLSLSPMRFITRGSLEEQTPWSQALNVDDEVWWDQAQYAQLHELSRAIWAALAELITTNVDDERSESTADVTSRAWLTALVAQSVLEQSVEMIIKENARERARESTERLEAVISTLSIWGRHAQAIAYETLAGRLPEVEVLHLLGALPCSLVSLGSGEERDLVERCETERVDGPYVAVLTELEEGLRGASRTRDHIGLIVISPSGVPIDLIRAETIQPALGREEAELTVYGSISQLNSELNSEVNSEGNSGLNSRWLRAEQRGLIEAWPTTYPSLVASFSSAWDEARRPELITRVIARDDRQRSAEYVYTLPFVGAPLIKLTGLASVIHGLDEGRVRVAPLNEMLSAYARLSIDELDQASLLARPSLFDPRLTASLHKLGKPVEGDPDRLITTWEGVIGSGGELSLSLRGQVGPLWIEAARVESSPRVDDLDTLGVAEGSVYALIDPELVTRSTTGAITQTDEPYAVTYLSTWLSPLSSLAVWLTLQHPHAQPSEITRELSVDRLETSPATPPLSAESPIAAYLARLSAIHTRYITRIELLSGGELTALLKRDLSSIDVGGAQDEALTQLIARSAELSGCLEGLTELLDASSSELTSPRSSPLWSALWSAAERSPWSEDGVTLSLDEELAAELITLWSSALLYACHAARAERGEALDLESFYMERAIAVIMGDVSSSERGGERAFVDDIRRHLELTGRVTQPDGVWALDVDHGQWIARPGATHWTLLAPRGLATISVTPTHTGYGLNNSAVASDMTGGMTGDMTDDMTGDEALLPPRLELTSSERAEVAVVSSRAASDSPSLPSALTGSPPCLWRSLDEREGSITNVESHRASWRAGVWSELSAALGRASGVIDDSTSSASSANSANNSEMLDQVWVWGGGSERSMIEDLDELTAITAPLTLPLPCVVTLEMTLEMTREPTRAMSPIEGRREAEFAWRARAHLWGSRASPSGDQGGYQGDEQGGDQELMDMRTDEREQTDEQLRELLDSLGVLFERRASPLRVRVDSGPPQLIAAPYLELGADEPEADERLWSRPDLTHIMSISSTWSAGAHFFSRDLTLSSAPLALTWYTDEPSSCLAAVDAEELTEPNTVIGAITLPAPEITEGAYERLLLPPHSIPQEALGELIASGEVSRVTRFARLARGELTYASFEGQTRWSLTLDEDFTEETPLGGDEAGREGTWRFYTRCGDRVGRERVTPVTITLDSTPPVIESLTLAGVDEYLLSSAQASPILTLEGLPRRELNLLERSWREVDRLVTPRVMWHRSLEQWRGCPDMCSDALNALELSLTIRDGVWAPEAISVELTGSVTRTDARGTSLPSERLLERRALSLDERGQLSLNIYSLIADLGEDVTPRSPSEVTHLDLDLDWRDPLQHRDKLTVRVTLTALPAVAEVTYQAPEETVAQLLSGERWSELDAWGMGWLTVSNAEARGVTLSLIPPKVTIARRYEIQDFGLDVSERYDLIDDTCIINLDGYVSLGVMLDLATQTCEDLPGLPSFERDQTGGAELWRPETPLVSAPASLRAGETERLELPGLALAYTSYLTRHLEPPYEPFSSEHPSLVWDALFERARVFLSRYRREDDCEFCAYPLIAGNRVSFLNYFELIEEPSDETASLFSAHPELDSMIQEASLWHLRLSTAAVDDQALVPPLLIPIPIEISGVYSVE